MRTNLKRELPVEDRVALAGARDLHAAKVLLRVMEARADAVLGEIRQSARIGCEDVRMDVRYKLGYEAALRWAGGLPDEVRELVEHGEGVER